jgi:hypothetical protein
MPTDRRYASITVVRFMAVLLLFGVSVPMTRPNVGIVIVVTSVWRGTHLKYVSTLRVAELMRDYCYLRQVISHHLLSLCWLEA